MTNKDTSHQRILVRIVVGLALVTVATALGHTHFAGLVGFIVLLLLREIVKVRVEAEKKSRSTAIRGEVEALVRLITPSEINNIDAMMYQFRDREEELLETLRAMQQRAINAQTHQKLNEQQQFEEQQRKERAYQEEEHSRTERAARLAAAPKRSSFKTATSSSTTSSSSSASSNKVRFAEEIEKGDWRAVSEQATRVASRPDLARSAATDVDRIVTSYGGDDTSLQRRKAQRAEEIRRLIGERNWDGVKAAAYRFSEEDRIMAKAAKRRSSEAAIRSNRADAVPSGMNKQPAPPEQFEDDEV